MDNPQKQQNTMESEYDKLKQELDKTMSENESMKQEYSKTMEEAEAHFRKYRARLEAQIEEKNREIQNLKSNRGNEVEEIESIKEKFNALKDGALKELKEYREVIVKHKVCQSDEVKQRGIVALTDFLSQEQDKSGGEKKKLESTVANLQRKIIDLEAKNQNLTTMIEYTREQSNTIEFKKCQDYIKELEKKLAAVNDKEFNKLKDENTILKAENLAFSKEIAGLNRKLDSAQEQTKQKATSDVPTHPLFWQNFMSNLESLLGEKETKAQPLQDKYIQTADKLTRPIFQRVIELKTSAARQSSSKVTTEPGPSNSRPSAEQASRAERDSRPPEDVNMASRASETGKRYRNTKAHPNLTYEKEIENVETLENIIFEQEDYIQKLESALDQYCSV